MHTLRSPSSWAPWAQYTLAVGAALLALGARWLLDPLLEGTMVFVTVFTVLILLVLAVRPGPFLAAAAVSLLGTVVLFIEPYDSPLVTDRAALWQIALFSGAAAAAGVAAWLSQRAQSSRRQVEAELVRRGEQLRLITDAMPALIGYVDAELCYQFVNARYAEWFGRPQDEIVGRTVRELLGEAVFQRVRPHVEAALAGRRSQFENDVPTTGGTREVLGECVPDLRADGSVAGYFTLISDITERKQVEHTLRESERRLATLVANLPGMAYRCKNDEAWSMEFLSERVRDIVGYDAQDFIAGRVTWAQVTHAEDLERVRQAVDNGVRARQPFLIEYRVVHRDQSRRWVWERGEAVIDARGEVLALEGLIIDITVRKQVEQELEARRARERSYLEHLPVGVWFANEKGELVFANAAARRIWGAAKLVGPREYDEYEAYWHGTDRRVLGDDWPLARALKRGETVIGEELDICTFGGTRKTILLSGVPVRDGDGSIVGAVLMNLDITEQKWAEAALVEADRRKDEFLATLAHELRNPLAAIHTATELLGARSDPEQLARTTAVIKRQVGSMVRLLDDLLDISRITHGRIELRKGRASLLGLVDQALEVAQPWVERKRHVVELDAPDDPLELQADAVRLVQVFTNLLSNACKYTDPGGRIHVRIARDGDGATVEIRDSGIGIPSDKLDVIFEMFSRLRARGRDDEGLGIGLALSRRLVELHGGSLRALSEGPGHGSRFIVRLPALPVVERAPLLDAGELGVEQPARNILIVDDNADAADSLALLLAAQGHVTRTAYDGASALAEIAERRPEVLLLDLGLPDIHGVEVCKAVRAQPWGASMLVIALSGWGQERDKLRTAAAGFDAHLTKPADLRDLAALLANSRAERSFASVGSAGDVHM